MTLSLSPVSSVSPGLFKSKRRCKRSAAPNMFPNVCMHEDMVG